MALKIAMRFAIVCLALVAMRDGFGQATLTGRQTFRDPRAVELKAAIASSDLVRVHRLLTGSATNDCLELDEQGATALHFALRRCVSGPSDARAFEVLKELASRQPCINAADRLGRKPILELAPLTWTSRDRMDALDILLAHGADVNAPDEHGATLLHQLLGTWNESAAHWPELVQRLIAAKANPNVTNSSGQTPLHAFFGPSGFCANRTGVPQTTLGIAQKVFAMLAGAGADLTIRDAGGTTPLGALLFQDEPFFGRKEIILGFISPSARNLLHIESAEVKGRPALSYLCDQAQADVDVVERILELGANPKQIERNGFSALHGGAWFYSHRICALLLAHGANPNGQDESGRTPLHELVRSTYCRSAFFEGDQGADILRTADVLLANGADRRMKDQNGKTASDLLKVIIPADEDNRDLWRQLRRKLR